MQVTSKGRGAGPWYGNNVDTWAALPPRWFRSGFAVLNLRSYHQVHRILSGRLKVYAMSYILYRRDQWFWRPNLWHKNLEGQWNEDLFIKNHFPKYWVVASILGFLVHKKYKLTLLWDENFFSLIRSNGLSKNPSFHTDFKNVHMTLVKSAPKKILPKKPIFNW